MKYFSGIEWVSGGHVPQCTAWVDKHFVDYYCLNYAHAGTVRWRTNSQDRFRILQAPVAWWTFPGPRFQYGHDGAPWDHYFVCFRGARTEAFLEGGLLSCDPQRGWQRVGDPAAFRRDFELVLGLSEALGAQRKIHCLESLLLRILEPSLVKQADARDQRMQRLVELIARSPSKRWDFKAEAHKMGLSVAHFHRLFRQHTHLPPQQFVIRSRLEAAAQMLLTGRQPLKQIAESSGFPDIYYFSRMFRRFYGIPPGQYRRAAGLP